ncbi:MAG: glycosyltransferase family 39 protein, partial [Clostridia bacterium]
AVMNILTIAVLYLAGAALFSRRAALYSALILSLSPLHLWYSQEIRGYTLAALLALLSVVFLILALEREKKAWWGGFILSSLLALFTYYQMSVVLAAAAISLLAIKKLRPKWREFFISCAVILICFSPYALTVIRQQSKIFDSALNWIIKPPPLALLFTFFEFNLGYSSTNFLYFVSGLIIIWIFTAGLRRGKIGEEKCLRLKLIAGIISFTIILTFAISQIMPFYLTRYLFPLSALYYLLIGVAIDGCRGKYKKFIVILLAGIMGISCFYYYQNNFKNYPRLYPRYPFHHGVHRKDAALEELMEIFNRNARQGDILAISHQSLCPVLFFYSKHYLHKDFLSRGIIYLGKNKGTVDPLFIPTFFLATERYLLQDKHLSGFMDHFQAHVRRRLDVLYLDRGDLGRVDFKRLWLIVSSWGSEESNFDPGSLAVKNWCNRNLKKIFQERRENTIIFLYENTGKL